MLGRRSLLMGLSASAATALLGRESAATTMRAVSLKELVSHSHHALVGTPVDFSSQWETIGKRRRIVTYATVQVEAPLDGRAPPKAVYVRLLGGRVGDIGQVVHGEARLRPREKSTVFLRRVAPDVFSVTAMAQGHYPLYTDSGGDTRLKKSRHLAKLVKAQHSAVRALDGLTLMQAEQLVLRELHAP